MAYAYDRFSGGLNSMNCSGGIGTIDGSMVQEQCHGCLQYHYFSIYTSNNISSCPSCGYPVYVRVNMYTSSHSHSGMQMAPQEYFNNYGRQKPMNYESCKQECESSSLNNLSIGQKMMLSKEDQALYKAGFIDSCMNLTEKGKQYMFALFMKEKKAELVKAAEELIAEKTKK